MVGMGMPYIWKDYIGRAIIPLLLIVVQVHEDFELSPGACILFYAKEVTSWCPSFIETQDFLQSQLTFNKLPKSVLVGFCQRGVACGILLIISNYYSCDSNDARDD
ncbi:hypothetical protein Pfo_025623 [Paulownia fortunei]|nr:hypothetical protein Pfo_025623 [Paulownia fortunei]